MKLLLALMLTCSLICYGDQPQENSESSDSDIVVIGEKLASDPFDVPGGIIRLDREELQEAGVRDIRDVSELVPNFQVIGSSSSRYITPYIRGLGNQDLNLPDEVSVTFYLDEVPLPRYAFENELIQIEKIEVLKGPQGSLFGKNTQAGAVLLTTLKPTDHNHATVTIGGGNLGQQSAKLQSNYVLSKKHNLYASTAANLSQRDGWIPDVVLNKDLGERQNQAFHQSVMYNPSSKRRWTVKVGGQREDGSDPFFIARDTENYPVTGQNISPDYRKDLLTSSLKIEERINNTDITFISAFNYYDFDTKYDEADLFIARDSLVARVGPVLADQIINDPNSLYREVQEYERQLFNELRFKTQITPKLSLTTGLNHLESNYRLQFSVNTFGQFGPTEIQQDVQLKGRSLSLFGHSDYHLTKNWILALGVRGNHDRKEYVSDHQSTIPTLPQYQQNTAETFQELTTRGSATYQWSNRQNTYFAIARGYQPGGYPSFQFNNYSGQGFDQPHYEKSTSWSYETGHKVQALNKRLHLEVHGFYNDVKNKQVRVQDPDTALSFYENIDSKIFGGEFLTQYHVYGPWSAGMSVGYTDSRFNETVQSDNNIILQKNDRLANIPYWNGEAHIQYSRYFHNLSGNFLTRLSQSYVGERFGDNINATQMSSFGLWNFKAAIQRKNFEFSVNARNLFDKKYESQAFLFESVNKTVSSPGLPRMIEANLSYTF